MNQENECEKWIYYIRRCIVCTVLPVNEYTLTDTDIISAFIYVSCSGRHDVGQGNTYIYIHTYKFI